MPYFFRKNRRGFPVFLYRWIVARCKMGSASCTHDRCAQRLESNSSGKNRNCTLPKNTYMSGILALYSLLLGRKFSIIVSKEFSRYMAAPLGKPQEGCAASSPPAAQKDRGSGCHPGLFPFPSHFWESSRTFASPASARGGFPAAATYTLGELCRILDCSLEDIAEYLPDEKAPPPETR